MNMSSLHRPSLPWVVAAVAILLLAACSEDGSATDPGGTGGAGGVTEPVNPRNRDVDLANGEIAFSGRLRLPEGGDGPFPVVAFMPGVGPWEKGLFASFDAVANTLLAHDIGFFAWDKRGCFSVPEEPFFSIDQPVYETASSLNLVADAHIALDWLRQQPLVDPAHIIVWAHGLGTTRAPVLASEDQGLFAMVLSGWYLQNLRDILADLFTYRTWYRASLYTDLDENGVIEQAEWDSADKSMLSTATYPSFAALDLNGDDLYTEADNQLAGELWFHHVESLVEDGDQPNWLNFWSHYWPDYPSVLWANDGFEWPELLPLLESSEIPTRIVHGRWDDQAPYSRIHDAAENIDLGGASHLSFQLVADGDHELGLLPLRDGEPPTPLYQAALERILSLLQ